MNRKFKAQPVGRNTLLNPFNVIEIMPDGAERIIGLTDERTAKLIVRALEMHERLLDAMKTLMDNCPVDSDTTDAFWQANENAKGLLDEANKPI